jgi:thiol:disulfide interchange protein DsbA
MRKILATVLIVILAACSVDEPPPPPVSPAGDASAPAVEVPPPAEPQAEPPTGETTAKKLAEAMDEEETAGLVDEGATESAAQLVETAPAESAAPERFRQGVHYQLLTAAQPTGTEPGAVEVLEVFWYGCPHCYSLEPHIQAWLKNGIPPQAEFRRMPAALNPSWQILARAYYTAEALGVLEQAHGDLFREFHVNRNPLNTPELLAAFFARYGISEEDFNAAFNSFAVQTKLRRADALTRRYRITGVPSIVVNGKYVTGASEAGGVNELFEVVNFLVQKEANRE